MNEAFKKPQAMMRTGRIEDLDRSFDLEFWQSQSDTVRFAAAWDLVVTAQKLRGKDVSELRLQRSIEAYEQIRG